MAHNTSIHKKIEQILFSWVKNEHAIWREIFRNTIVFRNFKFDLVCELDNISSVCRWKMDIKSRSKLLDFSWYVQFMGITWTGINHDILENHFVLNFFSLTWTIVFHKKMPKNPFNISDTISWFFNFSRSDWNFF